MIDWESKKTEILLNPRMPDAMRVTLESVGECPYPGHILVTTSGSEHLKWVALSKQAILTSAAAVNAHLDSNSGDIWLSPLPHFHVGGLGILARCHLSGATLHDHLGWMPQQFHKELFVHGVTLTALVPTQVYDLVRLKLTPPPTLRAVIVGGGVLSQEVYQKGKSLGWPLLASYGLTECASQVATATPMSPRLTPLTHVQIAIRNGKIALKSPSLLTAWTIRGQWVDPKIDGWFQTDDLGSIEDGMLRVMGRESHFIKIGGESVDLLRLQKVLQEVELELDLPSPSALVARTDPRLGHVIHLVTESQSPQLVDAYNRRVFPFEHIRQIETVAEIPRSPLGKPLIHLI